MENTNTIWSRNIPRFNKISLIAYLIPLFTIDLFIVTQSPDLMVFWIAMFVVLGVFIIFYFLEKNYAKKFMDQNPLDTPIFVLIILRNILFFLNFLPYIQLLGIAGIIYIGWILLIVYIVLIAKRSRSVKLLLNK